MGIRLHSGDSFKAAVLNWSHDQLKAFFADATLFSLKQRAKLKFYVWLEKSPSEMLEMPEKAYGHDYRTKELVPVSTAKNKIEGTSFSGFRLGYPKFDVANA
ncbi:hypothetical protein TNCV_1317331 [Trichonephila clavipes]|nr:hypothetical protein TNCV_1317331 [Trichonephila clavipes]